MEQFNIADDLKIISNYAVGYNNIDVSYANKKGIIVTNTPDVLTDSTADIALLLILMVSRRAMEAEIFTRDKLFIGWSPDLFLGVSLADKILGVIGFGRIGLAVAKRAQAFGMKVLYNKRNRLSILILIRILIIIPIWIIRVIWIISCWMLLISLCGCWCATYWFEYYL